jgi:hypothetical protein
MMNIELRTPKCKAAYNSPQIEILVVNNLQRKQLIFQLTKRHFVYQSTQNISEGLIHREAVQTGQFELTCRIYRDLLAKGRVSEGKPG